MKVIPRNKSVYDAGSQLSECLRIPKFPVFMGTTDKSQDSDLFADLVFGYCNQTDTIQLTELLPLDLVYQASHQSGVVGELWRQHHSSFAAFVNEKRGDSVLEIGSGSGVLSNLIDPAGIRNWIVIDINPVEENHPEFVKTYSTVFGPGIDFQEDFDTIIHSHFFEHIYDPMTAVKQFNSTLPMGGKVIMSIPNMQEMLDRHYLNILNFEHTFFLNDALVRQIFVRNGFKFNDIYFFKKDHSIFLEFEKISNETVGSSRSENDLGVCENRNKFLSMFSAMRDDVSEIIKRGLELSSEKIFIFGAHVFTQYLLNLGLEESCLNIECILDNDEIKQGSRLYGSKLRVNSPNVIVKCQRPVVIMRAGVYTDEIKRQLLTLNNNCCFL